MRLQSSQDFSREQSQRVDVQHLADKTTFEMKSELVQRYRKILRRFERELFFQNVSSCCNGVSLPQCHALLEVENQENITVTELSEKLTLEKSTVSRTVDNLVKKGYLNREIPEDNRRTVKLQLTKEGAKTCENINWNNNHFISNVMDSLAEDEQKEFLKLFEKITMRMAELRLPDRCC